MSNYQQDQDIKQYWFGEIQPCREVRKIKFIDDLIMGQSPSSDDVNNDMVGIPFLQGNAEFKALHPEAISWCTEPSKIAKNGDVLLSVRAPVGAVNIANQSFAIGRGLAALRPQKANGKYLYYLALAINDELRSLEKGSTFKAVTIQDVKNIYVPFFEQQEQQTIAKFLDHKTALIDQYIANKQRQLQLLDKLRTSIISEAVTQSLNPDAEMKDSGVEWLDKMPKHWEYRRLKFTASLNNDVLSENTNPLYEIEYVDIGSVTYEHGITSTEKLYFSDAPTRARRLVQDGDTIISTVRTYLKAIACIKKPPNNLIVSTGFAVIRPKENVCPSFLGYFIQSKEFVDSVMANSDGVSYPAINSSRLASLPVFLPGLIEQQAIAQFLDHKAMQIDQSIYQLKEQITKMETYRTSLITEAVTGKIDVRDFKLPATEVSA